MAHEQTGYSNSYQIKKFSVIDILLVKNKVVDIIYYVFEMINHSILYLLARHLAYHIQIFFLLEMNSDLT